MMEESLSVDLELKRKASPTTRRIRTEAEPSLLRDSLGWLLVLLGVGLLLLLVSFDPTDPSFFNQTSKHRADNLLGPVGAFLADFCMQLFGFGSYLFPFLVLFLGVQVIRRQGVLHWYLRIGGGLMIWFSLLVILGGFQPIHYKGVALHPGGTFGIDLWIMLSRQLNPAGTYLLLLALCGLALMMATQLTLAELGSHIAWVGEKIIQLTRQTLQRIGGTIQRREMEVVRDQIVRRELEKLAEDVKKGRKKPNSLPETTADSRELMEMPLIGLGQDEPPQGPHAPLDATPALVELAQNTATMPPVRRTLSGELASLELPSGDWSPDELQASPAHAAANPTAPPLSHIEIQRPPREQPARQHGREFVDEIRGEWQFPNSSFFQTPKAEHKIDEGELLEKAQVLERKFQEFGVTGEMKAIHPGPVVTTYEFRPDAGIKYSRIVNLTDDLCLALGAESVRIDRMPGRYSVGMEVPNTRREIITFREMVDHSQFRDDNAKLLLALGKTIDGTPYFANLASMPHLLIAGQTGSGKSVGINAMICSILMRATPQEVKLIMIDPKMVEMGIYADIPHLLTPVVVDPEEAANALKWAVHEMEERYRLLAAHNHRSLEHYNRAARLGQLPVPEGSPPLQPLPFIVILIDELADLMMVARGEVEESIARIAQKSRAVGIHLILATQRPSVDIITGVIKSNLPCRLSYRVSQRNDSRIILDGNGAEKLLGKGDGLFLPPGTSRLVRIHAPFLSENEIMDLIGFLKQQGQPQYQHQILKSGEEMEAESAQRGRPSQSDDPMYEKAARLVVSSGQASVSYLQRKLGLGFARAAKLVDSMEANGLVGPGVGAKPREILVPADYFDRD
jgi:S-DNA-T family DNA segregation ATPase FtsK/SpoIIIE